MEKIRQRISEAQAWSKVPENRPRMIWALILGLLFLAILPEIFQLLGTAKYLLLLIPVAAAIALVRLMLR
jgi:hypothetical protein